MLVPSNSGISGNRCFFQGLNKANIHAVLFVNLFLCILIVSRQPPPLKFRGIKSNFVVERNYCGSLNSSSIFFLETLNLFTLNEATCFISTIIQVYQKSRSRIFPFLTFFLVYNTSHSRMNTFCPEFSNSFSDSGHLSGYLDSVLHSPQQQCLVPTISLISRTINQRID